VLCEHANRNRNAANSQQMGPVLDPGSHLSLPIPPSVQIELFEMRSLGTMLPSSLTCYVCLFLPLLGSLLSFFSGHFSRPRFYFSSTHCFLLTLLLFVKLHLIHFLEMDYSLSCCCFLMQTQLPNCTRSIDTKNEATSILVKHPASV
jgi:hypothetical protein